MCRVDTYVVVCCVHVDMVIMSLVGRAPLPVRFHINLCLSQFAPLQCAHWELTFGASFALNLIQQKKKNKFQA